MSTKFATFTVNGLLIKMRNGWLAALMLVFLIIGSGCERELKDPDKEVKYDGPTMENHDVTTLYSDSAKLVTKIQAPVQQEFETGDRVFPKGFYVEFFNAQGSWSLPCVVTTESRSPGATYTLPGVMWW
ncbi:hypothetical protein GCM10028895_35040 [Pontibacter rugosus]